MKPTFVEFGADALTKRLAQVMTREVATCGEAETAVSIMERMTAGRFRHIPVVELDQLVGIVSIGDIVKHRLWVMEQESRHCASISRAHRRPTDALTGRPAVRSASRGRSALR